MLSGYRDGILFFLDLGGGSRQIVCRDARQALQLPRFYVAQPRESRLERIEHTR